MITILPGANFIAFRRMRTTQRRCRRQFPQFREAPRPAPGPDGRRFGRQPLKGVPPGAPPPASPRVRLALSRFREQLFRGWSPTVPQPALLPGQSSRVWSLAAPRWALLPGQLSRVWSLAAPQLSRSPGQLTRVWSLAAPHLVWHRERSHLPLKQLQWDLLSCRRVYPLLQLLGVGSRLSERLWPPPRGLSQRMGNWKRPFSYAQP